MGEVGTIADAASVPRPGYARSALSTGIVHFGLGNFHRAHQAMFLDRLMNRGEALDWGICGVGVMEQDRRMRDVMRAQDNLYTLVLEHPDGRLFPRIVGSIHRYLYAPDDPQAVLDVLGAPATRIVSLTITEGGYNIDRTSGAFDVDDPAVRADAAHPRAPRTAFGLIVEGLRRRRAAGTAPFTVMSCDNVPDNGRVARRALVGYAGLVDRELAEWIGEHVAFPNSMVDRITPVTTDAARALVEERFGYRDAWPVVAEPFVQWVLEDDFPLGRPPLEDAGVQMVRDVVPYELMKLRLLNAGHQGLAYAGWLRGHAFAHEAATDPLVAAFVRAYWAEARPTLAPVPGVDLDAYVAELLVRFANPAIADTLARLAQDASDRIPKFVLPAVRDNLAAGRAPVEGAALVACWARCWEGEDEQGRPIRIDDPFGEELARRASEQRSGDPLAFLRFGPVFGDLADRPEFARPYAQALRILHEDGVTGLLTRVAKRRP